MRTLAGLAVVALAVAVLAPFRASRFAGGKPWHDEDNYGRERLSISR